MSDYNSSLPIRTENNGDAAVKIVDGTITSQALGVDSAGRMTTKLNDGAGNSVTSQASGAQRALDVGLNVAGVQIDPRSIRALTSADVVTSAQGTAAALTGAWPVKPTDGTNSQTFTASGEAKVVFTQAIPAGTNNIGKVSVQDSSGNAFTASNPLPVVLSADLPGTKVNKYNTTSSLAAGASATHTYTITTGKTFSAKKFWAAASGKIRMDVKTSPDGTTFSTFWTGFNSVAFPNVSVDLDLLSILDSGAGSAIQIVISNLDHQAFDVYSTISGTES